MKWNCRSDSVVSQFFSLPFFSCAFILLRLFHFIFSSRKFDFFNLLSVIRNEMRRKIRKLVENVTDLLRICRLIFVSIFVFCFFPAFLFIPDKRISQLAINFVPTFCYFYSYLFVNSQKKGGAGWEIP